MFLETIKSEGLAHLSYLVGSGGAAAVIDPRRDCEVYIETARARGCRIHHIFETHRNEDYLSGAPVLAELTGAEVHHGSRNDGRVAYADEVREGDDFAIGQLRLEVLETPGHTDDSVSYVLYDTAHAHGAVAVFTGDALFIGDVGRTDFYPDRATEVAGLLHESLQKLLSLGDQAIVCPAHGAGSVCGGGLSEREFSTLGHERHNNPMLQLDRDAFVAAKVDEFHLKPPYFARMEALNLSGAAAMPAVEIPEPMTADAFDSAAGNAVVVDVRAATGWLAGHLPGSLSIPAATLPAFAGWLLDPEDDLLLVSGTAQEAALACRHLGRVGYDRVRGFLTASLPAWAAQGRRFETMAVVDSETVARRTRQGAEGWCLLDVRDPNEVADGAIEGSRHIYVGHLPARLDELDPERSYSAMCATGVRATIAASVLARAGFPQVDLFLGSMGAWKARGGATTGS